MSANQEVIRLLDKEYTVACPPEQREGLLASARQLDTKMREIRTSGKVVGSERIVVMAALNVIFELLREREGESSCSQQMHLRLQLIQDKIDAVLEKEERQLTI
ncbi:MAG: cell division protein ZapA [Gammaproteobacteria bacterium]|nr:cell division protein ZapA [Gammaproteobacteria bacterium]